MPYKNEGADYITMHASDDRKLGGFLFSKENGYWGRNKSFVLYANERDLNLNSNGGDVYIGGFSSGNDLRVNGKIFAKEIEVKTDVFPDYVFNKNYRLASLSEIESHISKNGHLPGMPSAKEVTQNGMNLKEIQLKLVEKIEELTLHMIQLNKENKELKEEIKSLTE